VVKFTLEEVQKEQAPYLRKGRDCWDLITRFGGGTHHFQNQIRVLQKKGSGGKTVRRTRSMVGGQTGSD